MVDGGCDEDNTIKAESFYSSIVRCSLFENLVRCCWATTS